LGRKPEGDELAREVLVQREVFGGGLLALDERVFEGLAAQEPHLHGVLELEAARLLDEAHERLHPLVPLCRRARRERGRPDRRQGDRGRSRDSEDDARPPAPTHGDRR
jgi:hypothetical protein